MAAFLAARTVSSRLATRPARVQRPQVSRPLSVKPMRCVRIVTRAVDKEKVLADVRAIIAEQLGTEVEKVTPEAKFVDLGADSLDIVEIMMGLEEKFGLTFDEEGASKISTVAEAAELIASQVKSEA